MMVGTAGVLCMAVALCAEPSAGPSGNSKGNDASGSDSKVDETVRVSVVVARDRAKIMHDIYAATLDMLHHRYFQRDRAILPARAMEDVFAEIKKQSKVEAQWISVNTKAMNIDHEPKSEFEKKAATEIAAGKSAIEVVEGGYYRRARVIPLAGGCISCHVGFFQDATKTAKFAGLVISVPVISDPGESK
jgi:hypothetical protein